MDSLLSKFKARRPSIIFEWSDPETSAEGWVVINSLRGGAAGGGTRMRKGLTRKEVASLAKVMEIKFTVSGPSIGGAKSGINFDPNDPRKDAVLDRWFKAVSPLLKHYYGTGGDLNVDEATDVIPITEDYGIWHPQEGIVNGHYEPKENKKIHLIGQLRYGVVKKVEDPAFSPDINRKYLVSDLITGYGVAQSVLKYYKIYHKSDARNKKAIIQGWGNVAGTAAYYLSQEGVKIVGIIDKNHGLVHSEGLSFPAVKELLVNRKNNKLQDPNMLSFQETDQTVWDTPVDIFIPGAASYLVKQDHVKRMMNVGLEVISCGANVPFEDDDVFFGPTAAMVDERISLVPDFIANCGMARTFAYLMADEHIEISDESIFTDVSETIENALKEVYEINPHKINIAKTSLQNAIKKLI